MRLKRNVDAERHYAEAARLLAKVVQALPNGREAATEGLHRQLIDHRIAQPVRAVERGVAPVEVAGRLRADVAAADQHLAHLVT
jgi:hypothetical protein